jgi:DNA-directed RNA polymerase subunit RPC12/RpoP
MRQTVTCSACGTVLGVPKSGMPADGLTCNWCGYVNLKAADPVAKPVATAAGPAPLSPDSPIETAPTRVRPEPHRWADDEDDNGQPYAIPRGEIKTRKCEECGKEIELASVVCVYCGYDARAKPKAERTFSPIDREWESGWPFHRRMSLFLVCQVINLATLAMSWATGQSLGVSIAGVLFCVGLQAFLLGTYQTLRIRRNRKGQAEIMVTWRLGFIPMAPKKLNWREHEGVAFGHYDPTSFVDWWMCLVLLPFFIIPAILWWWFVIRSDRYFAALTRDRGYPETYLYRGMNEVQAKEIGQTATDATGLPLTTPL